MRRAFLLVLGTVLFLSGRVGAQTAGERPQPPQPVQGWTAPQPTQQNQATSADPWQPFPSTPGIQAGAFTMFPSVTGTVFYDDNVFATTNNRQASWAGLLRPGIAVNTAGSNYALEASGVIEKRWYARFPSEDQLNGAAAIGGLVMPDADTQLVGKVSYSRAHEDRGAGESLLTIYDRPVGFDTLNASGAINKRFNRWWTSLGVAGSWIRYDTPTIGGIPIDQSYRDGNVSVGTGRVGYVVAPFTSVFAEFSGNRRNFLVDMFDSYGYRAVGGVLLEPGQGARVRGEAYAGYMYQNYAGITFNTVSTVTYGGALAFLIAPRWTVAVKGSRVALESILNGGVSVIESLVGAQIEYQVTQNLLIGAGASYLVDEFLGASRTDRTVGPLVSLKYMINPHFIVAFDYRNLNFDSSGIGVGGYYRNIYLLSLNAKL